jgi:thiamine-monophosphate kinase
MKETELKRRDSPLAETGEFGLIHRLTHLLPPTGPEVLVGIGDDAAILRFGDDILLATTDALLEGVHFRRDWTSPEDLGWKSLAVNLSDLAAMGGTPRFTLITLGIPSELPLDWLERFYRGVSDLGGTRCPLLGGDTVASPDRIYLNLTVIGEAPQGRYATRSGARPGDLLFVTGTLGDSLAGYYCLRENLQETNDPSVRSCLRAHRRPMPRLEAGLVAVETGGVHAMMDVSDGLSGDVRHIAERSGVGVRIHEERLPISDDSRHAAALLGKQPRNLALQGGEDYELLMAVPPDAVERVRSAVEATGIGLTAVGEVVDASRGLTLVHGDGSEEPLPRLSWDHFAAQ